MDVLGFLGPLGPQTTCARTTTSPRYEFCFDKLCGSLAVLPMKEEGGRNVSTERDANSTEDASNKFFFVAGSRLAETTEELDDIMEDCRNISRSDVVQAGTSGRCAAWCEEAFGERPPWEVVAPLCSMGGGGGDRGMGMAGNLTLNAMVSKANILCAKVRLAAAAKPLRPVWWQGLAMLLYTAVGVGLALRRLCTDQAPPKDQREPRAPRSDVSSGLESLDLPLCCAPSQSDQQRARWQLGVALPGALLDNPLDVLSALTFIVAGQPYYAMATMAAVAAGGLKDPFQARGYVAAYHAWRCGMPTRSWLEHLVHEGGSEAPIGGFIALFS